MDTITAVLISVHVLISVALIALVLLNSGKGGGLSDMLGGPGSSGQPSPIGGVQATASNIGMGGGGNGGN